MQRRLAAILAADVVGYSRLMGEDEVGTLKVLKAVRAEVVDPKMTEYKGRIFKTTGDGVLAEFASVVDAASCAVEIQRAMNGHALQLRIGVHLGDVIVEEDDIFGDGVNLAARVEGVAPPGGVALSASAFEHVGNRLGLAFDDMGEQSLKNIDRPIKVYCARLDGLTSPPQAKALSLPAKPSIAVLPFANMSSDSEQEHFADGLTEDLITDLSRNAGLFVIARNSTFAYKGKSVDARRIASDLGVRYLLEGSARRASGRVRINVQLIDAAGGGHLWAERFDRNLEDIFAVQDEVTARIVEALVGRLTAPLPRNRPKSLDAYELCVQARSLIGQSPQAAREAHVLLERAIALDPEYGEAYRWLAMHLLDRWSLWGDPIEPNKRLALAMAERAVTLDPNDAGSHVVLGSILNYESRWPESEKEFAVAIELDPNSADAWAYLSDSMVGSGRPTEAIDHVQKALRLNPHPPGWYYWVLGQALYGARDYENAIEVLKRSETYRTESRKLLAASLAQFGKMDEARREAELFILSNPRFTLAYYASTQSFRDEAMRQHFIDGYRKAGLPE